MSDWKDTNCPWGCTECEHKEELRDLGLSLMPHYKELLRPLGGSLLAVTTADNPEGDDSIGPFPISTERVSRSFTKADPSFTLRIITNWMVGARGHYYGADELQYQLFGVSEDGRGVMVAVAKSDYGTYTSADRYMWFEKWPDIQAVTVKPRSGVRCPECDEWKEVGNFVSFQAEFDGDFREAFFCSCGVQRPLDEMDEYREFEELPEEFTSLPFVIVDEGHE